MHGRQSSDIGLSVSSGIAVIIGMSRLIIVIFPKVQKPGVD